MRYENGEPVFLGYSVEPYWGEDWVKMVMEKLNIDFFEATKILELGGEDGRYMSFEQVKQLLK